jgi:hypothetical protein
VIGATNVPSRTTFRRASPQLVQEVHETGETAATL